MPAYVLLGSTLLSLKTEEEKGRQREAGSGTVFTGAEYWEALHASLT